MNKLYDLKDLPQNWDGYDGIPAGQETIDDAKKFLSKLPNDLPQPRIGYSGDGEISLLWDYGYTFLDVGFVGDESYSYYGLGSYEIFGDDIHTDQDIPDELIKFIGDYR